MSNQAFNALPWCASLPEVDEAVRPVRFRNAPGAFRAPGSRDISTVIWSDPPGSKQRRFLHEFPAAHPSLELRHISEAAPASAAESTDAYREVGHAMRRSVDLWLDSIDSKRSSTGELPTRPSEILRGLRDIESQGEREAPDSLVVRIARDDRGRIAELCGNPRAMLRRERRLSPIGRARELDPSCMRWLDMQPGRTIPEKAGSRQRIRTVVRTRSLATLENRVLRDLMLRAHEAGVAYIRQNSRFLTNTRVRLVKRLVSDLSFSLDHAEVAQVPALVGTPTPNYVLQNDRRYRYVWKTWLKLVRKQQVTQSLLWWGGRWCSELAFLGAAEALEIWEGGQARYSHDVEWRAEPHQGEFFESAAPVGTFVGPGKGRDLRVDLVRSSQAARGLWQVHWGDWIDLAPDLAIVARDEGIPPLLVWSVVLCDARQEQQFTRAVDWLRGSLRTRKVNAMIFRIGGMEPAINDDRLTVRPIERPIDIPTEMLREVERLLSGSERTA